MKLKFDPEGMPKLIVEKVYMKGMSKLTGSLYQVFRQVHSLCSVSTIHYNNSKEEITDLEEILSQISIGKQTFRGYGLEAKKQLYSGFDNVLKVPKIQPYLPPSIQNLVSLKERYMFNTKLYNIGHDPIPMVKLYNNPNVTFITAGGIEEPFAIACYDPTHGTLHQPGSAQYSEIFQRFELAMTELDIAAQYVANIDRAKVK